MIEFYKEIDEKYHKKHIIKSDLYILYKKQATSKPSKN